MSAGIGIVKTCQFIHVCVQVGIDPRGYDLSPVNNLLPFLYYTQSPFSHNKLLIAIFSIGFGVGYIIGGEAHVERLGTLPFEGFVLLFAHSGIIGGIYIFKCL